MITGKLSHNASTASPINFASEYGYLSSTSLALAQMTANGTTTVTPWHAISLTGMEDINIFNLDGNALSHASSLTLNIGADDIAIVNVSGTLDDFSGFGIFGYQGHQEDIIYNFYEADQLTINNKRYREAYSLQTQTLYLIQGSLTEP